MKSKNLRPSELPGDAHPRRRRLRHRLEWLAVVCLRGLVRACPLAAVRAAADALGWLGSHLDRRGRRTALENLRVVYGAAMDEAARKRLVTANYRRFARTFLEMFWTARLRKDQAEAGRWWTLTSDDLPAVEEAAAKGAVFVTPHFGNFEWLATGLGFHGHSVMIVAQDFKNPLLTPVFSRERARAGHEIVPQQMAMIRLFRHVARGGSVALLPDLTTKPTQAAAVVRCFGRPVSVTTAHIHLALRTGRPLVPSVCLPAEGGRYRLHFCRPLWIAPGTPPWRAAQACWDVFEPLVRQHPEFWLWIYKHWRYLPADADPADFPAYANRSRAFDRLAASQPASPPTPPAPAPAAFPGENPR